MSSIFSDHNSVKLVISYSKKSALNFSCVYKYKIRFQINILYILHSTVPPENCLYSHPPSKPNKNWKIKSKYDLSTNNWQNIPLFTLLLITVFMNTEPICTSADSLCMDSSLLFLVNQGVVVRLFAHMNSLEIQSHSFIYRIIHLFDPPIIHSIRLVLIIHLT